jgi:hypothetical protein
MNRLAVRVIENQIWHGGSILYKRAGRPPQPHYQPAAAFLVPSLADNSPDFD